MCAKPEIPSSFPWCYLFIHHTKVESVSRKIKENFPIFIHKSIVYKRENKRIRKEERPTISGLIFVQGDGNKIEAFLKKNFFGLHLVKDCSTKEIATIDNRAMQAFMQVSQVNPTHIRFMLHPFDYYAEGHPLVRITSGVLAGFEGYRVRIAGDKCIITSLGGMTVAIGGIHKESFENLDEYARQRRQLLGGKRLPMSVDLTPLQAEVDRCFFPPQDRLDVMAIAQSLFSEIQKARSFYWEGNYDAAAEMLLFLLEAMGGHIRSLGVGHLSDGYDEDVKSVCCQADEVLDLMLDDAEVPMDLKEVIETEKESLAIRFPFLPIAQKCRDSEI